MWRLKRLYTKHIEIHLTHFLGEVALRGKMSTFHFNLLILKVKKKKKRKDLSALECATA